jgi:transducin (beta)-like 1
VQTDPRYRFGDNHGQPYSARNGALLTLDTGIPAHELAAEANGAVQEPPPKKGVKRKKAKQPNGVEPRPEPETNGDAMEVEQNGNGNGIAHVTNSVRAESDAPVSEADSSTVAEIPISTLSIGQDAEIQTELIADLAQETIFVPRSKEPGRLVQHTSWGPAASPVLLAAGKSVRTRVLRPCGPVMCPCRSTTSPSQPYAGSLPLRSPCPREKSAPTRLVRE